MDKLKGIEVPTLILVGEKELKAVTESAKDLGKLFINSEIFTIRGGNQNHPRQCYDQFNSIVKGWIENKLDLNESFKMD
ncbi:pimeloyl-ACP methyl ester carboxylesterase [Clostridium beijerinckii]|nr:alpha/beta hydrolase [Clostridium beijerinckii]NRV12535.1 pimeloyl-ACP methyl ester carboxylesterase [Clostridium beijerinckii]NRV99675.1 pimeloyl-ACP methyl ester carboxylesterase [Clostridium beijerinckii]NSB22303.1 pimeloyl-ACP methyl ester carboxylesterase [Clostridium beijerinckii]